MMKIVRCFLACVLVVSIFLMGIPENAMVIEAKAESVKTGTIGDNLIWEYSADGTLTISGSGTMPDYTTVSNYYTGITTDVPWEEYLNDITRVVISEDVVNVGKCAFSDCPSIKQISLPLSIEKIGESAFTRCIGGIYFGQSF